MVYREARKGRVDCRRRSGIHPHFAFLQQLRIEPRYHGAADCAGR
jgi:hypothetical protein